MSSRTDPDDDDDVVDVTSSSLSSLDVVERTVAVVVDVVGERRSFFTTLWPGAEREVW